jgi:hypothetical protein
VTVTDDPPISAHIGDPLALLCSQQARQIGQFRLALMYVTRIAPAVPVDVDDPLKTMRRLEQYVSALKLELAEARASAPPASATQPKENHG